MTLKPENMEPWRRITWSPQKGSRVSILKFPGRSVPGSASNSETVFFGFLLEEIGLLSSRCDSLRRSYDVLRAESSHSFLKLMDLPHENGQCAQKRFKDQLLQLAYYLEGLPFHGKARKDECIR